MGSASLLWCGRYFEMTLACVVEIPLFVLKSTHNHEIYVLLSLHCSPVSFLKAGPINLLTK